MAEHGDIIRTNISHEPGDGWSTIANEVRSRKGGLHVLGNYIGSAILASNPNADLDGAAREFVEAIQPPLDTGELLDFEAGLRTVASLQQAFLETAAKAQQAIVRRIES